MRWPFGLFVQFERVTSRSGYKSQKVCTVVNQIFLASYKFSIWRDKNRVTLKTTVLCVENISYEITEWTFFFYPFFSLSADVCRRPKRCEFNLNIYYRKRVEQTDSNKLLLLNTKLSLSK